MIKAIKNMEYVADERDLEIIRELRKNSRRSFRELSRAIGISPAALINRIKKLENDDIILGYDAKINFYKLGYDFMGLIQVNINKGALLSVQEKIAVMPGVVAVYDITGEYDSMAIVFCKSRSEMSSLIKKINKITEVRKTNTSIILNVVKRMDDFQI